MTSHKVLVLGASGMLGNAVFRYFATRTEHDVVGVVRSRRSVSMLAPELLARIVEGGNVEDADALAQIFGEQRPSIVINCVGLVKQLESSEDPLAAIPINAVLPHRLARLCTLVGARLVHLSTDCVFSGRRGMYVESDIPDVQDVYGRTKLLGEVSAPNAVTLRTSIIGHELSGSRSLVGWFLAQSGPVQGYARAIFSGLPTVEIARVIANYVLPRPDLSGIYHLSAAPIDKFSLLQLIADAYDKPIKIDKNTSVVIDRSLDSARFREATGYEPDDWPVLIQRMHDFG
jgi:dTDP-4-dehydrorhamnose reductase